MRSQGRAHRQDRKPRLARARPGLAPAEGIAARVTTPELHRSQFPPIASYAFLSDCQVNALIAPNGSLEWLCVPRHDAPSVFTAMLDRDAGSFRVGAVGVSVPARREYVPGSLVLETVWQTSTGWLTVRDALCMTPWRHHATRAEHFRRAPPDYEAAGMIVRTIECTYGHVEIEIDCSPSFEYGARPAHWEYASEGYGSARASADGTSTSLVLTTDLHLGIEARSAHARTLLQKGERAFAALAWGDVPPPRDFDEASACVRETVDYWQRWLDLGKFPDHPWRMYLQRSALTIKGLTYAPTGALIAAATTSLPETPGGARNWDYRFTWLRDAVYTLRTLERLGYELEARDYTRFLADAINPEHGLQIMYGIGGERNLDERVIEHLRGYDGARPVRIGNGAYDQQQHDVWGNIVGLIGFQALKTNTVPEDGWRAVQAVVAEMRAHWREPDRGIWEIRGEPKHFVSSKVMCWLAADGAARLAHMRDEPGVAAEMAALAEEIRNDVLENGVDERGVFTQHYGSSGLDASNLLMATLHFLPPTDPRLRATVLAIADELTVDGLVLRYRTGETDDGLEGEEGTFCICSFWLVSALAYIGELDRARRLCEKLLTFASPLHLYAEEIDAKSGRHLGNFPQAFSHLSMTDALIALIAAESAPTEPVVAPVQAARPSREHRARRS
jgi:GH15 family glucan-1,4-alpha-glucosidase